MHWSPEIPSSLCQARQSFFEVALPIAEGERIERLEHRATTLLAQNPVTHVLVTGVVNRVAELVSAKGFPGRFYLEQKLSFDGRGC